MTFHGARVTASQTKSIDASQQESPFFRGFQCCQSQQADEIVTFRRMRPGAFDDMGLEQFFEAQMEKEQAMTNFSMFQEMLGNLSVFIGTYTPIIRLSDYIHRQSAYLKSGCQW